MDADSLLTKIKAGDQKAFEELFDAYKPVLTSYARLFMKSEWADDVVQDVFFNLWQHRGNLNGTGSIQGYLLKSTYNTSVNYLSKRKYDVTYRSWFQRRIEEMAIDIYNPATNDVIANIYTKDLRSRIDSAILQLPPKCREVFCMSYIDDMQNKQIAKKLGISVSTVENHVYAALKKLREILSDE
jgi:RNA polymerase sigma-70 factor (ECF subfamily)